MKNVLFKNYYFLFLSSISILLLVLGFFAPPIGEISNSVLIGVGEIFAFCSLGTIVKSIDQGYDAHLQHKDTSIDITRKDIE